MNLIIAIALALMALATGIYFTSLLAAWVIQRAGFALWMAVAISVLLPMYLSSFVLSIWVFMLISGVKP